MLSVDELLASPRLKLFSDRIAVALEKENAARIKFREEMNEDTRAEFINGKMLMHSPIKWEHNRIAVRILKILDDFVGQHQLGAVGVERVMVAMTRNDVEADVAFWKTEKASQFKASQLLFPPPDLVVEIISPSTESIDRGTKLEDYAAHGVTEYWIVDPDQKTFEQYLLKGEDYELKLKSGNGKVNCVAISGGVFNIEAFFDDELARRELSGK